MIKLLKKAIILVLIFSNFNCKLSKQNSQSTEIVRDTFENGLIKTEGEYYLGKAINEWSYYNYDSTLYRVVIFLDKGNKSKRNYIVQDFMNNQLFIMKKYLSDTLFSQKIYNDSLYTLYKLSIVDMKKEAAKIKEEERLNGVIEE